MGMAMQDQLGAAPGKGLAESLAVQKLLMPIGGGTETGGWWISTTRQSPSSPVSASRASRRASCCGTQAPGRHMGRHGCRGRQPDEGERPAPAQIGEMLARRRARSGPAHRPVM